MPEAPGATTEPDAAPHRPKVSVGMPVYNGEAHLAEALDSLGAQTFRDFEVVICDNASTDGTAEIVRAYAARDARIRFFRNAENLGAAANFNRVFELARGEYFKWFAHDDRLEPEYLRRCVEVLDADGSATVLVFPTRVEIGFTGEWWGPDTRVRWNEAAPPFDRISFARLMLIPDRRYPELVFGLVPTEALRRTRLIGPHHCADLVLVTELRMLGRFRHLPEPLFVNRIHERRSVAEEAAWYDPENAGRLRRPAQRLLRERLRGVWRCDAGFGAKLWCSLCVIVLGQLLARTPLWTQAKFGQLMGRIYGLWEWLTASAIVRSPHGYGPHRAWMLLAAVRRLDRRKLKTALGPTSSAGRDALCAFVAERLARRRDTAASNILQAWHRGTCPHRRAAAARALGRSTAMDPAPEAKAVVSEGV